MMHSHTNIKFVTVVPLLAATLFWQWLQTRIQ